MTPGLIISLFIWLALIIWGVLISRKANKAIGRKGKKAPYNVQVMRQKDAEEYDTLRYEIGKLKRKGNGDG